MPVVPKWKIKSDQTKQNDKSSYNHVIIALGGPQYYQTANNEAEKDYMFVSSSYPSHHHLHIDLLPNKKLYCSIKFQTERQTLILAELELKEGGAH